MATAHSLPSQYSDEEWRVRCDLAACYRLFVNYGWTDLIYTHISARHPDNADHYLINPYGLMFDEIVLEYSLTTTTGAAQTTLTDYAIGPFFPGGFRCFNQTRCFGNVYDACIRLFGLRH